MACQTSLLVISSLFFAWISQALAGGHVGSVLGLNACDETRIEQVWFYNGSNSLVPQLFLYFSVPYAGDGPWCAAINEDSSATHDNATVWTAQCDSSPVVNTFWNISNNGIQSENAGERCLTVVPGQPLSIGSLITTAVCNSTDPAQAFTYDESSGLVMLATSHGPQNLCVDAAAPESYCSLEPQSSWPFCNAMLGLSERAADIVARLSLNDKIEALATGTPFLPSVKLPAYNWGEEASHGLMGVRYDTAAPFASNAALPITTGASFNRSLWHATGGMIGREARAFMNLGNAAGGSFWAPVINLVRDPRWGRNLETSGEDPFLVGEYAVAWSLGFQTSPDAPYTLQASACCKHFVGNELEAWNGSTRHTFNAVISQQDLVDSYLPPFEACVERGRATGVMCSYNAVNGIPSCANDWLLATVLRGSWQFDGYVTADCDADADVFFAHNYTATPAETVRDVLRAGTDVDCGGFTTRYANASLANGTITEEDIDKILLRLFMVRLRLGYFDPPGPLSRIGADQVCTAAARELARDGARQGSVLLKNTKAALPLNATRISSIAVIGPNGNYSEEIALYYAGQPCDNAFWTLIDAVKQFVPSTSWAPGLESINSTDDSLFPAAISAAIAADAVVFALGNSLALEKEGQDRLSIDLPVGQQWLVGNVTKALATAGRTIPVVAVTYGGGMPDVSSLLADSGVSALLHAGYPSVQVLGVGDVLFGRTPDNHPVAPAGRMTQTTYPSSFVEAVSLFDMGMRPGSSPWPPGSTPGRTHRFYTGVPVLPFGYGLSYTTWTYTPFNPPAFISLQPVRDAVAAAAVASMPQHGDFVVEFFVNVTNTGDVDSDDVVLGFLVPPGNGTDGIPQQEMFGFERVHVPAGQTVTVYLGAQADAFTQAGGDGKWRPWPGKYIVRFGVRETAELGQGFAEVELHAA